MPDLAAERADINMKITAASTAVTGLTDDASDTAITSAEMAVAAAKKAVMDSSVPDTEKSAFNTAIATIEGTLGTKKTSIMAARKDAADKMKKDMADTGKAMRAALGPPATPVGTTGALANIGATALTTLSDDGLAIDATSGAGALPDGTGGTTALDPDSVTLEAGASVTALDGWKGMDYALTTGTGTSKVTNEARVYTNQGAPTTDDFGDVHTLDTNEDFLTVTDGNLSLVMAAAFTHSGQQSHAVPDRSDAVYIRGTYDGASGEYRCASACSSTNDGSGSPSALGGTWTFTPAKGAMVSRPDNTYLFYGWWVRKDSDGGPTAASAFAGVEVTGGVDANADQTAANALRAGDGTNITGSATYAGHAAGKFAMSNPLDGTGNGGHFTADAELTANFGAITESNTNGVTGTIDNFRLNDGSEDPGWSVTLSRSSGWGSNGEITGPTSDATVWSINGNKANASGAWSGAMYDELPGNTDATPPGDGSNIPTTVTGTFYSEFSTIGRMVGAFGTDKQ